MNAEAHKRYRQYEQEMRAEQARLRADQHNAEVDKFVGQAYRLALWVASVLVVAFAGWLVWNPLGAAVAFGLVSATARVTPKAVKATWKEAMPFGYPNGSIPEASDYWLASMALALVCSVAAALTVLSGFILSWSM